MGLSLDQKWLLNIRRRNIAHRGGPRLRLPQTLSWLARAMFSLLLLQQKVSRSICIRFCSSNFLIFFFLHLFLLKIICSSLMFGMKLLWIVILAYFMALSFLQYLALPLVCTSFPTIPSFQSCFLLESTSSLKFSWVIGHLLVRLEAPTEKERIYTGQDSTLPLFIPSILI